MERLKALIEANTVYTYIHFVEVPNTGKTKRFNCVNNRSTDLLGEVKWNGAWRQYCFYPQCATIFSAGCLMDVKDFITKLKESK